MTRGSAERMAVHRAKASREQVPAAPSLALPSIPAESILSAILTSGGEPVLVFDRRGRVVTGNAAAGRAVGLALRELPGAGMDDLALPEELRRVLAPKLAAVLESGVSREDGPAAGRRDSAAGLGGFLAPVRGPDGEVLGAVCRLGGGTADSDDRERFRALVDSVNEVAFSLDREMRLTGIYGRWLEAEGIPSGDLLGRTLREILGPEQAAPHEEATRRALAGEHVVYEGELETRQGRRFYQLSLAPVRGAGENAAGAVGIGRDVTDRRHEQEELSRLLDWSRAVKEEWKATLDSLPVFVALIDFVGCVVRGNRTLEAWGLRGPGELSGVELHALLHPGCAGTSCYLAQAQSRAWNATLEGRELAVEAEDSHLRRFVRVTFRPALRPGAPGGIPTMLAIVEDRSATRQAQLDRDRMERQLGQAQRSEALARLAGGLAQEFNSSSQSIGDDLRFLREGAVEVTAALQKVRDALVLAGEGRLEAAAARELEAQLRASDLDILAREMPEAATRSIEGVARVTANVRALSEFSGTGPGRQSAAEVRRAAGGAQPVTRHR